MRRSSSILGLLANNYGAIDNSRAVRAVAINEDNEEASLLDSETTPHASSNISSILQSIDSQNVREYSPYVLYVTLFLLAAFSEFGFAFYSDANSIRSVSDPLAHFAPEIATHIGSLIALIAQILAFTDASASTLTSSNMKKAVEEFVEELKKSINKFQHGEEGSASQHTSSLTLLILNALLIFGTFIYGSFSPITGMMDLKKFTPEVTQILGWIMFVGQMILYSMSYGGSVFSGPGNIETLWNLSRNEKIKILKNIFCTRTGWFTFLPATLAALFNRALSFRGGTELTAELVFGLSGPIVELMAWSSAACAVWQTFLSQGAPHYIRTFGDGDTTATDNIALLTDSERKPNKLYVGVGDDELKYSLINADGVMRSGVILFKDLPRGFPYRFHTTDELIPFSKRLLELVNAPDWRSLGLVKGGTYLFLEKALLPVIALGVFILRTVSIPSLWVGPKEDPAKDYGIKDLIIALIATLFAGYGSKQYVENFIIPQCTKMIRSLFFTDSQEGGLTASSTTDTLCSSNGSTLGSEEASDSDSEGSNSTRYSALL